MVLLPALFEIGAFVAFAPFLFHVTVLEAAIMGAVLGAIAGFLLSWLFEFAHNRGDSIRQSFKVIITLSTAFLMIAFETRFEGIIPMSGLLAVMSMACIIQIRSRKEVSSDLSQKYGRLWLAAEVILFVLVGAAENISYTLEAGAMAIVMILIALVFRSAGVLICLIGTNLNIKEKLLKLSQ